jgi:CTP:molybdopterin cytidylyltransferase MocA/HD superfamily phosphodiesterase
MKAAVTGKIIVVAGNEAERVAREAERLGCMPVYNPDFASGMFSSVAAGLSALPPETEAFFVLPADTPLVKPFTYRSLADAFYSDPKKPEIVYPTFRGERGHPPLLAFALAEKILSWRGEGGLRGFLGEYRPSSADVPSADRAVTLDMDAPEDYERLTAYASGEMFPDEDECAELLEIARTPETVVLHSRAAADAAFRIADALGRKHVKIDKRLLLAACLLHDIAKGKPDHDAEGARLLRERGYAETADAVASHKDLPPREAIGEPEVLYLADKTVDGTRISTISARAAKIEARFAGDAEALAAARRRISAAEALREKIEAVAGTKLEEILGGETIGQR